jgi:hypothetical protein
LSTLLKQGGLGAPVLEILLGLVVAVAIADSAPSIGLVVGAAAALGLAGAVALAMGSRAVVVRWTAAVGGMLFAFPALAVIWAPSYYLALDGGN